MPNPFGAPELSVQEVDAMRKAGESLTLLDVREVQEYVVSIAGDDVIQVPLSDIAAQQLDAIPPELANKEQAIAVYCHHGMRSAQAVMWMMQNGWTNVKNVDGGIDAWANEIDPSVGTY